MSLNIRGADADSGNIKSGTDVTGQATETGKSIVASKFVETGAKHKYKFEESRSSRFTSEVCFSVLNIC